MPSEPQHDVGNAQSLRRTGNDGRQHGLSKFALHGHVRSRISIRRWNTRRGRRPCTTRSVTDDDATDDVSRFIHDATSDARHEYGISGVPVGDASRSAFSDDACAYGSDRSFTECDGTRKGGEFVGRMKTTGGDVTQEGTRMNLARG
jgi:hypothetical protein